MIFHHTFAMANTYLCYWQFLFYPNVASDALFYQTMLIPTLTGHCEWNTLVRDLKRLCRETRFYSLFSILYLILHGWSIVWCYYRWYSVYLYIAQLICQITIYCQLILLLLVQTCFRPWLYWLLFSSLISIYSFYG